MEATRAQVLAHRAAVQGLHGGVALDDVEALALGFVDSPPKTGGVGIAVRTGPVDLDGLVRVLSLRGAPHLHRRADLPVLRRELRPRTPRQFAAWVGGFDPPDLGHLDLLIELLRREFPGDRATKGELSAAVSPLLPADWTPWCEPCGADHVVDGLFRLGTLLAGLELEHVGARLVFRKPTGPLPVVEDAGEPTLLRAYARLVGPFAKADAEKWLGAGPRAAWPQELRPVTVDGRGLLVSEDVAGAGGTGRRRRQAGVAAGRQPRRAGRARRGRGGLAVLLQRPHGDVRRAGLEPDQGCGAQGAGRAGRAAGGGVGRLRAGTERGRMGPTVNEGEQ